MEIATNTELCWYKAFLKREFVLTRVELLIQGLAELFLPLLLLLLYIWKKTIFFKLSAAVFTLPEQIYVLLGFSPQTKLNNVTYYMFFLLMLMNAWIVWLSCHRAIHAAQREEENGTIYLLMNQICSRKQLYWIKYIWVVGTSVFHQLIWYLYVLILIMAGCINQTQRMNALKMMGSLFLKSMIVLMFTLTVTYLLTIIWGWKKEMDCSYTINMILFGTLCVANLYKIRDICYMLADQVQLDYSRVSPYLAWLNKLHGISPLSWMNPYRIQTSTDLIQMLITLVLIILIALGGFKLYLRRNFQN